MTILHCLVEAEGPRKSVDLTYTFLFGSDSRAHNVGTPNFINLTPAITPVLYSELYSHMWNYTNL